MFFNFEPLSALAEDMGSASGNLSEYGANVTLSGIVIVFSMLVLLVLLITVFGIVMSGAIKKSKKSKTEETVKTEPVAAPVVTVQSDDDELIAVISAAVAAMYDGTGKKAVVKSIRPATGGRKAWANAGIQNNTKAF